MAERGPINTNQAWWNTVGREVGQSTPMHREVADRAFMDGLVGVNYELFT